MTLPLLLFCLAAFGLGFIGTWVASRNLDPAAKRKRWVKFAAYFVIFFSMLLAAAAGPRVFCLVLAAIAALGAVELFRARVSLLAWPFYLALCTACLTFAYQATPQEAIYVYIVVACFDGFCQISGQLFGRLPLAPAISPGKTIEGAVGGFLSTALVAVLLAGTPRLSAGQAIRFSLVTLPAALGGDLAASWLKRRAGIKDFGTLLPGHGGVLDRFDSLLGAAPIAWLLLHLWR